MINSNPQSDFDSNYYMEVNAARDVVFHELLPNLVSQMSLHSAVDVGCGIGYYASFLASLGVEVTGLDGRSENVDIAQSRLPAAKFIAASIEDLTLDSIGSFDLVFCAGLLYHLENPFRAIRNLRALCRRVCVVESRVHWGDSPVALFVRDGDGPTQALNQYAMILTRRSMINMMYAAGFSHVYSVEYISTHEELRGGFLRKPRRHIFVCATEPVNISSLRLESPSSDDDMNSSTPYTKSKRRFFKSLAESIYWLS